MTELWVHLIETDYPLNFPGALDAVPIVIDTRSFIDDWLFNKFYTILNNIQIYLILHKATIEA